MNERLSDERLKILEANFHPNAAAQRASVVGEEIYALAAEVIERRAASGQPSSVGLTPGESVAE